MAIQLNPVPFYDESTPYHYTSDNVPLQALEQNTIILRDAIESFTGTYFDKVYAGNLVLNPVNISIINEKGKPFIYRLKIWATSNAAQLSPQNSSLNEYSIIGSSNTSGIITFEDISIISSHSTGAVPSISITSIIDTIVVSFSGPAFNTENGFTRIRVERFGI